MKGAHEHSRISGHIRSNVIGYLALFIALGGTAWAADIGPADIADNAVRSEHIKASAVGTSEIKSAAVKSSEIKDGEVDLTDLAYDPTTQAELGAFNAELQASDGNAPNSGANRVHWDLLTGMPAAFADGVDDAGGAGGGWLLGGNAGTNPASDFLGTTDNAALNLRVNNARAFRLEPASNGPVQSPNVIGGTVNNTVAAGVHSATIGGGGVNNFANPATGNRVTDNWGTVGGGSNNRAGDNAGTTGDRPGATVGGGQTNTASGGLATVGGGGGNAASGVEATVGGGQFNTASGEEAAVGGGLVNTASGLGSTVPGGFANTADGDRSLAAGQRAKANHAGAFVWADSNSFDFASTAQDQFNVRSTGGARLVSGIDGSGAPTSGLELLAGTSGWSTLVSGQPFDLRVNGARAFRLDPASNGVVQSPNVIGGIADNTVTAGVHSATIAGGGRDVLANPATANTVTDSYGTVGGGARNQAGDGAGTTIDHSNATVAGGRQNTASGVAAFIGGGQLNAATGNNAMVGGGVSNRGSGLDATVAGGVDNDATADRATVAGGQSNIASGAHATVAGGQSNTAGPAADHATVGGGFGNDATANRATVGGGLGNTASGSSSTVGGGGFNTASGEEATVAGGSTNAVSGVRAFVGGGHNNSAGGFAAAVGAGSFNQASGDRATVPGGNSNVAAGPFSFAAGNRAKANHSSAFVWADAQAADMASTAPSQFIARASGRFFLQSDSSLDNQGGFINTSTGGFLSNGGTWTNASDENLKSGFGSISPTEILDGVASLPIRSWHYKAEPDVEHIGPVAQDFYRAFGVGPDDRHIASVDADGVALAAIKGLNERFEQFEAATPRAGEHRAPASGAMSPAATVGIAALCALVAAALGVAATLRWGRRIERRWATS